MEKRASDDEIRLRAYALYLGRDRSPGGANEDWLRAEGELTIGEKGGHVTVTHPFTWKKWLGTSPPWDTV